MVAFIRLRRELIHRMPKGDENTFPTPRSLTKAAKYVKVADVSLRQQLFAAHIGADVAGELNVFIELYQSLGDLEDIVKNPKTATVPTEASQKYAVCTGLGRLATRGPVAPMSVHTRADAPEPARFVEWFGCPVEIGEDAPSMVFADAVMERPFLTANAGAWSYFEPGLRPGTAGVDPDATMGERVRSALLESLPGNRPSIDAVCRRLAV